MLHHLCIGHDPSQESAFTIHLAWLWHLFRALRAFRPPGPFWIRPGNPTFRSTLRVLARSRRHHWIRTGIRNKFMEAYFWDEPFRSVNPFHKIRSVPWPDMAGHVNFFPTVLFYCFGPALAGHGVKMYTPVFESRSLGSIHFQRNLPSARSTFSEIYF